MLATMDVWGRTWWFNNDAIVLTIDRPIPVVKVRNRLGLKAVPHYPDKEHAYYNLNTFVGKTGMLLAEDKWIHCKRKKTLRRIHFKLKHTQSCSHMYFVKHFLPQIKQVLATTGVEGITIDANDFTVEELTLAIEQAVKELSERSLLKRAKDIFSYKSLTAFGGWSYDRMPVADVHMYIHLF